MGIDGLAARMILHEHRYRPIKGTVLTIGRQSIGLTGDEMDDLLKLTGTRKRSLTSYETDQSTFGVSRERPYISQESFFDSFTGAKVLSLDVSDYEGADIVCDLQGTIAKEHHGVADFIYNGSCLDNIFDPAAAMRNMSRLLKPGGRVYHYEQGNSHPTAYLKYSADWFMDFYALNEFEDCKVYIADKPNTLGVPLLKSTGENQPRRSEFDIVVYSFNPYVENAGGPGYDCSSIEAFTRYEIHCIAEKAPTSTDDRIPIQKHYRVDGWHNRICLESAGRFFRSARPVFVGERPFDSAKISRIDSSDYPEQIKPAAVF
jgi:SAM-dependent methyltransferase